MTMLRFGRGQPSTNARGGRPTLSTFPARKGRQDRRRCKSVQRPKSLAQRRRRTSPHFVRRSGLSPAVEPHLMSAPNPNRSRVTGREKPHSQCCSWGPSQLLCSKDTNINSYASVWQRLASSDMIPTASPSSLGDATLEGQAADGCAT